MGDEGTVVKLLLEMMNCIEDSVKSEGSCAPIDLRASPPMEPDQKEHHHCLQQPVPQENRGEYLDGRDDDQELVPASWTRGSAVTRGVAGGRHRVRDERRRVLRMANQKLSGLDEEERCMRGERDLRQQVLLQNMAVRLEAEARAERAARLASRARPARSYSRTLGRSFGGRDLDAGAGSVSGERKRRPQACDDHEVLDVQQMFCELECPPTLLAPLEEPDELLLSIQEPPPSKRLRSDLPAVMDSLQEQIRFPVQTCPSSTIDSSSCVTASCTGSSGLAVGCGVSVAGFSDFQHIFQQLVPSMES